jgi:membrane protein implicated in regulation of membrane protease activity
MSGWLGDPWIWIALGAALMLAELALPGYVMLGFGLAAVATAGVVALLPASALAAPQAGWWLLLGFALAAVAAWAALARLFGRAARDRSGERDINDFENRG